VLVRPNTAQLWISGQLGCDAAGRAVAVGDPHAQAVAAFENITRILEAAEASWADVAVLHIYVTSAEASLAVREVRESYLHHPRPASTMVIVSELGGPDLPDFEVEIEALAILPEEAR
jgi:enamine deaminase RidA (YjgF/YER057c/UK114 family)